MKRAFVIGGIYRFIEQTIAPMLAEFGIEVDASMHLSMDRRFEGVIPPSAEVVIVFEEMVQGGTRTIRAVREASSIARVACVVLSRHKSHARKALEAAGFQQTHMVVSERIAAHEEKQMAASESLPVKKTPTAAPTFDALFQQLGVIVKQLRDQHGVSELMWTTTSALELKRTEVRNLSLDL